MSRSPQLRSRPASQRGTPDALPRLSRRRIAPGVALTSGRLGPLSRLPLGSRISEPEDAPIVRRARAVRGGELRRLPPYRDDRQGEAREERLLRMSRGGEFDRTVRSHRGPGWCLRRLSRPAPLGQSAAPSRRRLGALRALPRDVRRARCGRRRACGRRRMSHLSWSASRVSRATAERRGSAALSRMS